MGSINPIGEGPKDPYEDYRVDPIEEKSKEGKKFGSSSDEKNRKLALYLVYLFQKRLESFVRAYQRSEGTKNPEYEPIYRLEEIFEALKKDDHSKDTALLSDLANSWEAAVQASLAFGMNASKIFDSLVEKIHLYPEDQTHSFGYYLSEYAGKDWIPFPYMDLVQRIHNEYQLKNELSALYEWSAILKELISVLQKEG